MIDQSNTASFTMCSIVECTDYTDDPLLRFLKDKFPKIRQGMDGEQAVGCKVNIKAVLQFSIPVTILPLQTSQFHLENQQPLI